MPVTIYSKAGCAGCNMTKKRFDELGIRYFEKHTDVNPVYLEEVKAMGYSSLPVVVAGEESWFGFRPDKIKQIA